MEETGTLKDNVRDYVKTQLDIVKLQAIGKGSAVASGAIVGIGVAILAIFILMFLGFSAAYAISSATGKQYLGFLLVAVFYIVLAVLLVVLRERFITLPLINTLMQKLYNDKDKDKESR
jgi:hypothetical protein